MSTVLRLAGGYLRARPLAAGLAAFLLALGVCTLSALALLDRQLSEQFARNLAGVDMVVGAKGSPLQLVASTLYHADAPTGNIPVESIRAFARPGHPLIERAVPLSLGDSYGGRRVVGTEVDSFVALYAASVKAGRLPRATYEVAVGATAARQLRLGLGDEFSSVHGLDDNPDLAHGDQPKFRVSALLAPTGLIIDELLLTDLRTVWDTHGRHDHELHEHSQAAPASQPWYELADRDVTALLTRFSATNTATLNFARNVNENTDLMAATPAIVMAQLSVQLEGAQRVLTAFGIVLAASAVLSLFVILLSALQDRIADLRLLRALGASRGTLLGLVYAEGLLLTVTGLAFGLLLSRAALLLVARTLSDRYAVGQVNLTPLPTEGYLAAAALAAASLAAAYPCWKAYQVNPGIGAD